MMDVSDSDKKAALDAAWVDLVACFGIGKDRKADPHRTISHTTTVALSKYGIAERTARFVQSEVVERKLREDVSPSFWAFFVDASGDSEEEKCARFARAINFLATAYTDLGILVDRMNGIGAPCNAYGQTTYRGLFNLTLKGTLHSQLPGNFEVIVEVFYARAFHVFCVRQEKDRTIVDDDFEESEDDGELECPGCRRERDSCICASLLSQG